MYKIFAAIKCGRQSRHYSKLLHIMRLSYLLCLCSFMQVSAASIAQKISLDKDNASLKETLFDIRHQSGYSIFYDADLISNAKNISIHIKNASLNEVLKVCFADQPFNYVIDKKTILITPKKVFPETAVAVTISGKIIDEKGLPIPGATVKVKNGTAATVTDIKGEYKITVPDEDAVLVFSFIGYISQELSAKAANHASITMVVENAKLDEVVVIGYGTQKVKDVTGSIVHIDATQHQNEHPVSIYDQLRANVPGLNIGQDVSASRGAPSVQIRGQNSLSASTNPLIILDGAVYSGGLSSINPEDIQSIDVLKDGSSAAIYGANSASGVIAITTKKGTTDKPVINVNATVGVAEMENNEHFYAGQDFLNFRVDVENSLHNATAATKPYQYNDPTTLPSSITTAQWLAYDASTGDPTQVWLRRIGFQPLEITNYLAGNETNWYNLSFQKGLQQDYTLSVSGKGNNLSYYYSGDYQKNLGIIPGNQFGVYRTRVNLDAKITNFLSVGMYTLFGVKDQGGVPLDWADLAKTSPYGSLYNVAGTDYSYQPVGNANEGVNQLGVQRYNTRVNMTYTLNSTLFGEITLPYGIKLRSNFTPNFIFANTFTDQSSAWPDYSSENGAASREESTTYQWQLDNLLTWNRGFKLHHFNVLLGQNASKFQSWDNTLSNSLFSPNDALGYNNIGAGTAPIVGSNDNYYTSAAYFGRLNYDYDHRYLLTATLRRDGNSAFGQSNPFGNFPSIGLGWVFTQEKFIKKDWLDYGKLRLTYSQNGNSNIGAFSALAKVGGGSVLNVTPGGTVITTSELYTNQLPNTGLQWEKTASLNGGIDFSLFRGILSGSVEAYFAKTTNLLANRTVPDVTGFNSIEANLGQVNNKGIEIALNSRNIDHENLQWTTSASFSLNRNSIVHLYGNYVNGIEQNDISNKWFIGQNIHTVWDYKVQGVYQNTDVAAAAKYGKQPGDFSLQDVNGDGVYTNADKQFLGNTTPTFRWTLGNQFTIRKDFTLSFLLYSNWGQLGQFDQAKNSATLIDRVNFEKEPYWTSTNATTTWARLQSNDAGVTYDIWRDASFIRLDNVAIGYTVPKKYLSKFSIRSLKLFATVKNPLVWSPNHDWTKYDWDPETTTPTPRTYTIGLNVTL